MGRREEEEWSDSSEEYLKQIMESCQEKATIHEKAGYIFKAKNTNWGLPSILLPVIMTPVTILIGGGACDVSEAAKYVNAAAFLMTGLITGVISFFKFGEKMATHFNYSAKYGDLSSDIHSEISKNIKYRLQVDVFRTKIEMRMESLANFEPVLPRSLLEQHKKTKTIHEMEKNMREKKDENKSHIIDVERKG